jgi:hypothetical protein
MDYKNELKERRPECETLLWKPVGDFRHAGICTDFVLVAARSPADAQGAYDLVLGFERHRAWKRHDMGDRCQPWHFVTVFRAHAKCFGRGLDCKIGST